MKTLHEKFSRTTLSRCHSFKERYKFDFSPVYWVAYSLFPPTNVILRLERELNLINREFNKSWLIEGSPLVYYFAYIKIKSNWFYSVVE